jgi:hypothetical protein
MKRFVLTPTNQSRSWLPAELTSTRMFPGDDFLILTFQEIPSGEVYQWGKSDI